jgi:hypothetical protein
MSTRFQHTGRMEDLEEVITHYHNVLALFPVGHPNHFTSLSNLASTITTRFEQSGCIEDLEEAIGYNHDALSQCPPKHPDCSTFFSNLTKPSKSASVRQRSRTSNHLPS